MKTNTEINRSLKAIMERRGVAYEELRPGTALEWRETVGREFDGGRFVAKAEAVFADGRLVVLILPAARRVVLDRVGKLLGADLVCLLAEADVDATLGDLQPETPSGSHPEKLTMLMDASMLSARGLVLALGTEEDSIRLKFEDWLALVDPGLGFFTEPDHVSSRENCEC